MARDYGRVYLTAWTDPEFLALTPNAKLVFVRIISSPDLTHAGCVLYTPGRWAAQIGITADDVRAAMSELCEAGGRKPFVYVDNDTNEALLRSHMRIDGGKTNDGMAVAVERAVDAIVSETLREIARAEMKKALRDGTKSKKARGGPPQAPTPGPHPHTPPQAPRGETEKHRNIGTLEQTTTTTGNSQLGAPAGVVVVDGIPLPEVAKRALDLYAQHVAMSSRERPKNPKRYMQGVIRHATADYGTDLLAYIDNNPDATAAQIAREVLYLTDVDLYRLGVA